MIRLRLSLLVALIAALLAPTPARGEELPAVLAPEPLGALAQRWDWATQEASRRGLHDGYWIGTSLRRLMDRNEFVGSFSSHRPGRPSLAELISGQKPPAVPQESREPGKVWKDVALLYGLGPGEPPRLQRVETSGLEQPAELGGLPLLWLGPADEAESLALLGRLLKQGGPLRLREQLLEAAALHDDPDLVVPILQEALAKDPAEQVREAAASALGGVDDPRATQALLDAARSDRSRRVRKEAVQALGESGSPEALKALDELARKASDLDVRKEAVEALARRASPQDAASLFDALVFEDTYEELRHQALDGLGSLPRAASLPILRRIVERHHDGEVRHKALELLVEAAPAQEAAALCEKIAFDDPSGDVQEAAVEALAGLPPEQGLASIRKLAATHPNPELRERALKALVERAAPADAVAELERAAREDASGDVREEAAGWLAKLPDDAGLPALIDIARSDRSPDLRAHALELLVKHAAPEKAAPVLEESAFSDSNGDVQETAIEGLADLPPEAGLAGLIRVARTHPSADRRKDAVEHLGKVPDARARKVVEESRKDEDE
jgi:HEAT repeat protein